MCGIAGVIKYGEAPITEETISLLLAGNEHRGVDATGIAFARNDGSIAVCKNDEPAWKFVSSKLYYEFIGQNLNENVWGVLLHTRAATCGSPRDNNNNHPMYAGKSAAIHNGVINNDKSLFSSYGLTRKADTDSDIVRGIVDKFGITEKAVKELGHMAGSAAIAVVHPDFPKHMMVGRSGSPLTIASNNDHFLFSSERNTLDRALKPWVKRFNTHFQVKRSDAAFSPFADNTIWIMGPEGLVSHHEFKSMMGKYTEPHRKVYENYSERQKFWDKHKVKEIEVRQTKKDDVEEAICPKCRATWLIPKGKNPNNFYCNKDEKGCGSKLVKLVRVN
jgi:predicted glutamine amidotransferase